MVKKGRPVFVDVKGNFVTICRAQEVSPGVYAVIDGEQWRPLGRVEEVDVHLPGVRHRVWRGIDSTGVAVTGSTKSAAVKAMLEKLTLYEITLDDATPSLFD